MKCIDTRVINHNMSYIYGYIHFLILKASQSSQDELEIVRPKSKSNIDDKVPDDFGDFQEDDIPPARSVYYYFLCWTISVSDHFPRPVAHMSSSQSDSSHLLHGCALPNLFDLFCL